jgi:hypothetical protein
MYKRVKSGKDNDGIKTPVTTQYAKRRKFNYNVAESVVFIASKQLAAALQTKKIIIRYKGKNLGNIARLVNRASS